RINNLVNEILDVSTIESKVYELKMETLNVRAILEELIENYRYFIEQKNIRLSSEIANISARLNRVYLTQIFDNLLSNAVKFTPEEKSIYVQLAEKDGIIIFSIRDEGPGISQDKIHQVFDQYNRQTSMKDQELVQEGLGLAIVSKYTSAMKGKVSCESEPGKGSKFIVELPSA
ncbi:MAG: HAMP domain-containing histidine kinase, partial [Bacteroidales bacterium]|nr:HAMP domain-containing histidine kinase [Bacteroidales bacterium]